MRKIIAGKKIILSILLCLALTAVAFFLYFNNYNRVLKVGFITDIHAGDEKNRDEGIEENNILIPGDYEKNLSAALRKMRDEKVNLVLSLGDNLNSPSKKYPERLKKIFKDYGIPVIWVRGNHDNKYFSSFYSRNYYYIDKGRWRIIVLDNSEANPDDPEEKRVLRGYIDYEQMIWLKKTLKKTKGNVLIAMHVPMLSRDNLNIFRDDQLELKKILEESGKVKYVLAGHYHVYNIKREENDITYYVLPSLSLKGQEGYYMTLMLD